VDRVAQFETSNAPRHLLPRSPIAGVEGTLFIPSQIAEADRRNDTNTLQVLIKQADDLAEKIGPEYVTMLEGLSQIEENSSDGVQIVAALDSLDKLCATK
jgi:hypothetical protein